MGNGDKKSATLDRFDCLIADQALTRWEQLTVGATTGGAFRRMLRDATFFIEGGEIFLHARTDVVAGRRVVAVAKVPVRDIVQIRTFPLPVNTQIRSALIRGLIVGGGFALTIIIALIVKAGGRVNGSGKVGGALAIAVSLGLAMGFLFSFLPSLFKLERDLTEVQFLTADGHVLPIALRPVQKKMAKAVLSAHGLKFMETVDEGVEAAQHLIEDRQQEMRAGEKRPFTQEERNQTTRAGTKKCPKCAEEIKIEAVICHYCRYEFSEAELTASEIQGPYTTESPKSRLGTGYEEPRDEEDRLKEKFQQKEQVESAQDHAKEKRPEQRQIAVTRHYAKSVGRLILSIPVGLFLGISIIGFIGATNPKIEFGSGLWSIPLFISFAVAWLILSQVGPLKRRSIEAEEQRGEQIERDWRDTEHGRKSLRSALTSLILVTVSFIVSNLLITVGVSTAKTGSPLISSTTLGLLILICVLVSLVGATLGLIALFKSVSGRWIAATGFVLNVIYVLFAFTPFYITHSGNDNRVTERSDNRVTERSNWNKANKEGTIPAYVEFLRAHPDGEFAKEAENRIGIRSKEQIRTVTSVNGLDDNGPSHQKFTPVYVTTKIGSFLAHIQAKKWDAKATLIFVSSSVGKLTFFPDFPDWEKNPLAPPWTGSGSLRPSFWIYVFKGGEENGTWLAIVCGLQGITDVAMATTGAETLLDWAAIMGTFVEPQLNGTLYRMLAVDYGGEIVPLWLEYNEIGTKTELTTTIDARTGSLLELNEPLRATIKTKLSLFD